MASLSLLTIYCQINFSLLAVLDMGVARDMRPGRFHVELLLLLGEHRPRGLYYLRDEACQVRPGTRRSLS